MPNHVSNTILVGGTEKEVQAVIEFMKADDGMSDFDFNQLIPRPKSLDITAGTHLSEDEKRSEQINIELYGAKNWYDWSITNWGTKWNAYDVHIEGDIISFDTAWSHPFPVIQALCEKFPDVTFSVEYADEDTGSNVGRYTQQNLEELEVDQPENGSKEAYKMAIEISGGWDYHIERLTEPDLEYENPDEDIANGDKYFTAILEVLVEDEAVDASFSQYQIDWAMEYAVKQEMFKYAETLKTLKSIQTSKEK